VLNSARIFGSVFYDTDRNGAWDAEEFGLVGWPVQLTDADGNLLAATLTDAAGGYAFEGLAPGVSYTIVAPPEPGCVQTAPIGGTFVVAPTSGQNAGPFDFGAVGSGGGGEV
jgi:hypothetical protein